MYEFVEFGRNDVPLCELNVDGRSRTTDPIKHVSKIPHANSCFPPLFTITNPLGIWSTLLNTEWTARGIQLVYIPPPSFTSTNPLSIFSTSEYSMDRA